MNLDGNAAYVTAAATDLDEETSHSPGTCPTKDGTSSLESPIWLQVVVSDVVSAWFDNVRPSSTVPLFVLFVLGHLGPRTK
eukprot:CAMPEP_0206612428 /NCGR_PEP_ID=MMETSP0325_2-20121206/55980_1 /ASSEMBLY_ACC=CAM_ASM_000347 /TAXON_ID=2866 /ORGANISM="Crypthecodinium cohnii, Strain Seligo" /LENGTH=80 /DNA_ID=CAMNT_0054132111 /DNA_START=301 /DNA_END=540 /DNA_ORIENTATION=+